MAHIARAEAHAEEAARATEDAIDEAKRYGTVLVGDVSNTLGTSRALAERNLAAVVFHELIGFAGSNAPRIIAKWAKESARLGETSSGDLIRHFPAAHAPYSVSPALFGEIRKALGDEALARTSVHLGESKAEIEFLAKGTGPWRTLLDEVNAWDDAWQVPGCTPVEYLDRQHFVEPRTLVVHGVHLPSGDLRRLAEREATLVTCPRGNIRTGAGTPPIGRFYESGVRVAIGTDSLASVPDLNLFSELAEMRRLAPGVPAGALLASATLNGAEALGYGKLFGSIQPGKSDRLLAIDLPDGLTDVEEYLVSGVQPSRIRWLAGPA
jgi:cytosine/adenosine deaminase-related metal-dependent hydrolase